MSILLLLAGLAFAAPTAARPGRATLTVPPVNAAARLAEDDQRPVGAPGRFAIAEQVDVRPERDGVWSSTKDGRKVWRLRVRSAGARNLNLGFTEAALPKGAELFLTAPDNRYSLARPLTQKDVSQGELWTPIVGGEELLIELYLPANQASALKLRLTSVNVGYRAFGPDPISDAAPPPPAGSCNNDVVCPEGDEWQEEIHAVGVLSEGGTLFCTGTMLNNVRQDGTPYFLTANHCGVSSSGASRVVVYWNFQSADCGDLGGGRLDDFTSGATYVSGWSTSDFTLIELNSVPDAAFEVSYAGWDATGDDATSAVGIHHPNTDEKAISFEDDPTSRTDAYSNRASSSGTHVRITDWDDGTTESGSSGSALFNQDHRVIGQLTGGSAACGNNESDWYGNFNSDWTGNGRSSGRLSDWLDPDDSGELTTDTYAPWANGLLVTPTTPISMDGPVGGPFDGSGALSLTNRGDSALSWTATAADSWVGLSSTGGRLTGSSTTTLTVSAGSAAASLPEGVYFSTVELRNTTDGAGDIDVPVQIIVGERQLQAGWNMDTDPGWTASGDWAWGAPTGRGGSTGAADPTSGYTGDNVYGYNLNGDYDNNMSATHLTTGELDLSGRIGTVLRFYRWLGVEEGEYDNASLSISTDGRTWTTVWANEGAVDDGGWVYQEIDLSEWADDQASVKLRWTMGATDRDVEYCGWNIDDVEIWAIGEPTSGTDGGTTDGGATDGGTTDGSADGSTDGSTDGSADGSADGSTDDGAADGGAVDSGQADGGVTDEIPGGDSGLQGLDEGGKLSGCACSGAPAPKTGLIGLLVATLGLASLRRRR